MQFETQSTLPDGERRLSLLTNNGWIYAPIGARASYPTYYLAPGDYTIGYDGEAITLTGDWFFMADADSAGDRRWFTLDFPCEREREWMWRGFLEDPRPGVPPPRFGQRLPAE